MSSVSDVTFMADAALKWTIRTAQALEQAHGRDGSSYQAQYTTQIPPENQKREGAPPCIRLGFLPSERISFSCLQLQYLNVLRFFGSLMGQLWILLHWGILQACKAASLHSRFQLAHLITIHKWPILQSADNFASAVVVTRPDQHARAPARCCLYLHGLQRKAIFRLTSADDCT